MTARKVRPSPGGGGSAATGAAAPAPPALLGVHYRDPNAPNPGIVGELCGAETTERVVRRSTSGPLHRARCNRWLDHDGPHVQRRPPDWVLQHEWGEEECRPRDLKEEYRVEQARSRADGVRIEVVNRRTGERRHV